MNNKKNRNLSAVTRTVLAFSLCLALCFTVLITLSGSTVSAYAATTVSAPTASVKAGSHTRSSSSMSVKLSCSTADAKIYYCIGSGDYKLYEGPVSITKTSTLKAYAVKDGTKSTVASFKYKLIPKVTNSKSSGTYEKPITVKLTTKLKNVRIYYTLDGTKPASKTSARYTDEGIKITSSCKLRILIKKTGWTSKYKSYTYEITPSVDFESINDYTSKPLYNTLSSNEQQLYAAIYKAMSAHEEKAPDLFQYRVKEADAIDVFYYVIAENPQLYWVNDSLFNYSTQSDNEYVLSSGKMPDFYIFRLSPQYTDSASDVKTITPKLQAAAKAILTEADKVCKTDFDYVLFFHDAVIKAAKYELGDLEARTYAGTNDILVDGHGLCTAYARAFAYLCQLKSIPCVSVTGRAYHFDGSGEDHCWNKVCIDGGWYTVDPTWDDDDNVPVSYGYLGLSDDVAAKNHDLEELFEISALASPKDVTNFSYYHDYKGYKQYYGSEDALSGLVAETANSIRAAGTLQSGDILFAGMYFWADSTLTYLQKNLDSKFWDMLSSKYPTEYRQLATLGATRYTSYGHNSVQVTIFVK